MSANCCQCAAPMPPCATKRATLSRSSVCCSSSAKCMLWPQQVARDEIALDLVAAAVDRHRTAVEEIGRDAGRVIGVGCVVVNDTALAQRLDQQRAGLLLQFGAEHVQQRARRPRTGGVAAVLAKG